MIYDGFLIFPRFLGNIFSHLENVLRRETNEPSSTIFMWFPNSIITMWHFWIKLKKKKKEKKNVFVNQIGPSSHSESKMLYTSYPHSVRHALDRETDADQQRSRLCLFFVENPFLVHGHVRFRKTTKNVRFSCAPKYIPSFYEKKKHFHRTYFGDRVQHLCLVYIKSIQFIFRVRFS